MTVGLGVTVDCTDKADLSSSTLYTDPIRPTAGQQITFTTRLVNLGGAAASNVVVTSTIPNDTTFIPASAWTSQGTATSSDPLVFDVGAMTYGAPVTLTFGVTVSTQITLPTLLSRTVTIEWTGDSLVRQHIVIANAETVYLPSILRSYQNGN